MWGEILNSAVDSIDANTGEAEEGIARSVRTGTTPGLPGAAVRENRERITTWEKEIGAWSGR